MPYVEPHIRDWITEGDPPQAAGQLAYALTLPIKEFLKAVAELNGRLGFQDLGDVVLALESVKGEFMRKVLWPYEDKKIEDNGDVDWGIK